MLECNAQVVETIADLRVGFAEYVLINLLRLEVAYFNLVHHIFFRVELAKPEVALRCLQAVVSFNRLNEGNVKAVGLFAEVEFSNLA